MRLRRFAIATLFAFAAGAVVACGDDDAAVDAAGDDDTATDAAPDDGAPGAGADDDVAGDEAGDDEAPAARSDDEVAAPPAGEAGRGSVVIGDETFSFEVRSCAVGAAETGDDEVLFSLRGEGDDDLAVDVTRRPMPGADPDGDVDNFDSVFLFQDIPVGQEYVWEALSAPVGVDVPTSGGFLVIDGDRVTGTADFLDRLDDEVPPTVVTGTFEATCP